MFLAKNPLGQIPVLECTDTVTNKTFTLVNSIAIIDFLDSAFPDRWSMIPKDPVEKALAMEVVDTLEILQQNVFLIGDLERSTRGKLTAKTEAIALHKKILTRVESLIGRCKEGTHGPFATGTFVPNIVDAVLVPQLYNARRFGLDIQAMFPILAEIDTLCQSHPWFTSSHPSAQPDAEQEGQRLAV